MHTLNLGILAHVDAGKTSLTERLLHAAGVIDEVGSVDEGSTQTDTLALERQRGITIKSAVVSFVIDGVTVNLIDTPGHPDFIAEVERALSVLDGAVLVVSAVEGVQAQTRVLMRTLQRLGIPTLIFVNKIDRAGADPERVLASITERLAPTATAMGWAERTGTTAAESTPFAAPAAEPQIGVDSRRGAVHPVFFGSAITGAGVADLLAAITVLLPRSGGRAQAPLSGRVFKIERGAAGERIALVRLFAGTVRLRDRLMTGVDDHADKITGIEVFDRGGTVSSTSAVAGQIARLRGLSTVRIGDTIGAPTVAVEPVFSPPTLETVVVPERPADAGALHVALTQLAEQDPLINFRQDRVRQELSVSLYGEVQKEVIQATLLTDYGVAVSFRATTTLCIERVVGTGAAVEIIGTEPNPFLATVGLRVEPTPVGAGVSFRLEVELGAMPIAFFRAVEETVRESLAEGLHGWPVPDCAVIMTHSGYYPRQSHSHAVFDKSMSSTAGDFRQLTPLVLMAALAKATTVVCEPMHQVELEFPIDALSAVLPVLDRLGAVPGPPMITATTYRLPAEIPAARIHRLTQELPGLTRGEGALASAFSRYQPVRGTPPSRSRTDRNPLNRKEYLRRGLG